MLPDLLSIRVKLARFRIECERHGGNPRAIKISNDRIGQRRRQGKQKAWRHASAIALYVFVLSRFPGANRYLPPDQVRGHASLENALMQSRREMFLVHGNDAEPALPEMTGAFTPRLVHPGLKTMPTPK